VKSSLGGYELYGTLETKTSTDDALPIYRFRSSSDTGLNYKAVGPLRHNNIE
jgi:hypothetical protein